MIVHRVTKFPHRPRQPAPHHAAHPPILPRILWHAIALGDQFSKAVRGVPESELALPFTEPVPIVGHAILRKLAPLMLLLYRRRDAREIA